MVMVAEIDPYNNFTEINNSGLHIECLIGNQFLMNHVYRELHNDPN